MESAFDIPTVPPQPVFDRSPQVGELMEALAKAQGEFDAATKSAANPYYNSKYADLATIIGAARPALAKHGIAFFHTVGSDLERQTASATAYLFKGDQFISAALEVPAVGKAKDGKDRFDAQTIGAAQTYCRRYTAAPLLGIAQEDDDGNMVVRDDARKVQGRTTPAQAVDAPPAITPEMERQYSIWKDAFAEADTVEKFNEQVLPLMKEKGKDFIKAAAQIAKERGYIPNRATGLYEVKQ